MTAKERTKHRQIGREMERRAWLWAIEQIRKESPPDPLIALLVKRMRDTADETPSREMTVEPC